MAKTAKRVARKAVSQKRGAVTRQVLGRVPRSMLALRRVGPRRNVLQIVPPRHIYMGPFWAGSNSFFEGFCKAIVEYGYLDPLNELNYGTRSGSYLGPVQGEELKPGTTLNDSDARVKIQSMLDKGQVQADANCLLILMLP